MIVVTGLKKGSPSNGCQHTDLSEEEMKRGQTNKLRLWNNR